MEPVKIIDRGRGPELANIRITIFDILPYVLKGWRADSIALSFGIRIVEVEALVRYFEEHREEILAKNQKILDHMTAAEGAEDGLRRPMAVRGRATSADEDLCPTAIHDRSSIRYASLNHRRP